MSRASTPAVTTAHSEQSLGPNLKSRLEALEAAMGVRLNVAKRQGRQSLSNTASSSPMQISPTSTSSSSTAMSTTTTTSLSTSSRHNIPTRSGQGVQRSASSCDTENRPGPIKRLKPSLPVESSSASTATAIATIKKYTPPARRPISTLITSVSSTPPKPAPLTKQRSSPMEPTSLRLSRSSTTNNNTNSNYQTLASASSKITHSSSSTKQVLVKTISSPTPSPARPATFPRTQRVPIFGEQFSDDILKTNLLWINLSELDDEGHTEVLIQFGSIENFLREQQSFSARQRQSKLSTRIKTTRNRPRLSSSLSKKDRLELL
ncbi:unnamed protein product [Adineta ricciae]|uniref:Uncharacterized protein n=1 Tax=Adineta ricciae TaxID=249248 RepID=A0A815UMX9_ADIRI|nr:unnamed protein product [Adineta ricciae]